ncbi:MAG: phosphotransferase [Verrucomicrobiae bacterium]|nr:phosphotransferase [Verrucomicrobiae bacterium]
MGTPLDIEDESQLVAWLRTRHHIARDESPRIRILAGGVSNRTVRIDRPNGDSWVLKQALSKLRVPVDWFCPPERVHREALGMRTLATLAPPGAIPRFLFEDTTHHLIAMEAVPEPHDNWKTLLLAAAPVPELVRQFGQLLGTLHRNAAAQATPLKEPFADRTYFENLRLEPFYTYTATRLPDAAPFLQRLVADTRAPGRTLVHGDYSPKNILVHQNRLILLDHEVIHWGDPMFDVGFATAHLLCKAHRFAVRRLAFASAVTRFWTAYHQAAGSRLASPAAERRAVRHTLACLLARAAGRSQVEYLSPEAKSRQCRAGVRLLANPPESMTAVAPAFLDALQRLSR